MSTRSHSPDEPGSVSDRRSRERDIWRTAFLISVALHVLLFLLWPVGRGDPESPFAAAGPRAADDRAAEGVMQALALQSAPPDAIQPPPVPVLVMDLPEEVEVEVEPDALPEVDLTAPELPEPGRGSTVGSDPDETTAAGLPTGGGGGDAGTADEGRFRVTPAIPRGIFFPPIRRGTELTIWVFVDEDGRVVPDSTRLEPPTSDRAYNQQLMRDASQWRFHPARDGGTPVAAWFFHRLAM